MKNLFLLVAVAFLATACAELKEVSQDVQDLMPTASNVKPKTGPAANPSAGDKIGDYKEPQAPKTAEQVDIKRDFPAYNSGPRAEQ